MLQLYKTHDIKYYESSSKYINKNRIVDRVIRTIRDLMFKYNNSGENINDPKTHNILIQKFVQIYNQTPHLTLWKCVGKNSNKKYKYEDLTPEKVQNDYTIEQLYINYKKKQLQEVLLNQAQHKLNKMKYGDHLKIYLDQSKTKSSFQKKRGKFITDAIFIQYYHGNVICRLTSGNEVIVPIYYVIDIEDKYQKKLQNTPVKKQTKKKTSKYKK